MDSVHENTIRIAECPLGKSRIFRVDFFYTGKLDCPLADAWRGVVPGCINATALWISTLTEGFRNHLLQQSYAIHTGITTEAIYWLLW